MVQKESESILRPNWQDVRFGNIFPKAGTATQYKTGDWRSERPIVDREKCNKCGLCWLYCPDGAMEILEDGYYEPDLYHCKGCGICANICAKKAITMREEGA